MTAPRSAKRKAAEAESTETEYRTKSARTNHERIGVDPWARVAATSGSTAGRGTLSGWTNCPLCGIYSKKRHALGRGIANHLGDVHMPWNPGKLAQKIHRRQYERRERERQSKRRQRNHKNGNTKTEAIESGSDGGSAVSEAFKPLASWTPTEEDKKQWAAKILEILQKVEDERTTRCSDASSATSKARDPKENTPSAGSKEESEKKPQSEDKSGNLVITYRTSLPPFLMAASNGDRKKLHQLVEDATQKDKGTFVTLSNSSESRETIQKDGKIHKNHYLRTLLNTRDRHKSTADHWAAGGGHLDCLRYLHNLQATLGALDTLITGGKTHQKQHDLESGAGKRKYKARRRDGKTCLHYAARNGHLHCIRYLLGPLVQPPADENRNRHIAHMVDERSGEGTTPLHLACYGGHPGAVRYLVEDLGADPHATNDWGCTCAHWAAMTLSDSEAAARQLCGYLSERCGVSFTETQGQGHTALHKAAHRRNRHVIRWMAGSKIDGGAGLDPIDKEKAGAPDLGGHKPSDIWRNMGGDAAFAEWMKTSMGW